MNLACDCNNRKAAQPTGRQFQMKCAFSAAQALSPLSLFLQFVPLHRGSMERRRHARLVAHGRATHTNSKLAARCCCITLNSLTVGAPGASASVHDDLSPRWRRPIPAWHERHDCRPQGTRRIGTPDDTEQGGCDPALWCFLGCHCHADRSILKLSLIHISEPTRPY